MVGFALYAWEMPGASELFSLPFCGREIDRASELRKDSSKIDALWVDPTSKVLVVRSAHFVPVHARGGLAWLSPLALNSVQVVDPIFLGIDSMGLALFGVANEDIGVERATYMNLRDIALDLKPEEAQAAAEAVALTTWHRRSPFCPLCGQRTMLRDAGHVRHCEGCAIDHFPRTDVAVIMLVSDGDRCVLGRRLGSVGNRWSTLAGFVEAGESPEAAIAREVFEEVGLSVDTVRYRGSQPWPFPASLMLAYEAHAPFAELVMNGEHTEVRWFTRAELRAGIESGQVGAPSQLSAGGHLIMHWISLG